MHRLHLLCLSKRRSSMMMCRIGPATCVRPDRLILHRYKIHHRRRLSHRWHRLSRLNLQLRKRHLGRAPRKTAMCRIGCVSSAADPTFHRHPPAQRSKSSRSRQRSCPPGSRICELNQLIPGARSRSQPKPKALWGRATTPPLAKGQREALPCRWRKRLSLRSRTKFPIG